MIGLGSDKKQNRFLTDLRLDISFLIFSVLLSQGTDVNNHQ